MIKSETMPKGELVQRRKTIKAKDLKVGMFLWSDYFDPSKVTRVTHGKYVYFWVVYGLVRVPTFGQWSWEPFENYEKSNEPSRHRRRPEQDIDICEFSWEEQRESSAN
ncbi:hypothetical protein LCGC14_1695600 [marine sediment metagenome]|uniref:Uncharacterized protein n=1 Tax=marine sediment metagenome TaxID=412755 RepID=A0A0F9HJB5_9ZZZZ